MAVDVGAILRVEPARVDHEQSYGAYPIQRNWQWLKNGTPIVGAVGGCYTVEPSDAGTTISVKESVYFIKQEMQGFNNQDASTSVVTETTSSGVLVNNKAFDAELLKPSDITYLGAFKLPRAGTDVDKRSWPDYAGDGITVAGTGVNKTMYCKGQSFAITAGSVTIPSPVISSNFAALPTASLVYPATSSASLPYLLYNSTINGYGVDPTNGASSMGMHAITADNKLLFSLANFYTPDHCHVTFRRPLDLSDSNPANLEGPFFIVDDSTTMDQSSLRANPRWSNGWYCSVPPKYQSIVGGDTLSSLCGISILGTTSNGATATSFYKASIDDSLARKAVGVVSSGAPMTIILDSSASSVDDFYVGDFINCQSASTIARQIVSYTGATRTAIVRDDWTIRPPQSGDSYYTIPKVKGNLLLGYPVDGQLDPYQSTSTEIQQRDFQSIWTQLSHYRGMVIPNNKRTLLFCFLSAHGFANYGPEYQIKGGSMIIEHFGGGSGPHQPPAVLQFHAFDLYDLASVKSGALKPNQVTPYASWTVNLPMPANLNSIYCNVVGMCLDEETNIMYVAQQSNVGNSSIAIHSFRFN